MRKVISTSRFGTAPLLGQRQRGRGSRFLPACARGRAAVARSRAPLGKARRRCASGQPGPGRGDGMEASCEHDIRRRHPIAKYRNANIGAAVLLSLAVGGWLFNSYGNAKPAAAPAMIPTAPVDASPTTGTPAVTAAQSTAVPGATPIQTGATAEAQLKIRTCAPPETRTYWCSIWPNGRARNPPIRPRGTNSAPDYVTLKQYDDALGAAKKALELAPDEPRMWRNVGAAHADVGDAAAALRAFDQAVARTTMRSRRFPANRQPERAIEPVRGGGARVRPRAGDQPRRSSRAVHAISRRAIVVSAQDTYAIARQVKAIDGKCRGT